MLWTYLTTQKNVMIGATYPVIMGVKLTWLWFYPSYLYSTSKKVASRVELHIEKDGTNSGPNYNDSYEIADDFEISYYPNPVENVLNINYEKNIFSTIYDITGKKLLESSDKNIDLSSFQGGVYIIHLVDLESNNIKYIKIIKK